MLPPISLAVSEISTYRQKKTLNLKLVLLLKFRLLAKKPFCKFCNGDRFQLKFRPISKFALKDICTLKNMTIKYKNNYYTMYL